MDSREKIKSIDLVSLPLCCPAWLEASRCQQKSADCLLHVNLDMVRPSLFLNMKEAEKGESVGWESLRCRAHGRPGALQLGATQLACPGLNRKINKANLFTVR